MAAVRDSFSLIPLFPSNYGLHSPCYFAPQTLHTAQLRAESKFRNKGHSLSGQQSVRFSSSKGAFMMVKPHCRMARDVSI